MNGKILYISTVFFMLFLNTATLLAGTYLITDFGAKAKPNVNNTAFIQKAIDKAAISGGTVVVPAGVFMTGTIQLKSDVTLTLNKNAILKGMGSRSVYPSIPIRYPLHTLTGQSGHALIFASQADNISITGEGTIDGNGEDPVFDAREDANVMRPYGLLIESCKNVTVEGICMRNSAMWMQRYVNCDFLRITGISVFNHANLNNDGLDIDDCHNVIISDCMIDADDDALCFKSEGDRGVKNAVITNCILASHASAFKFGTGSTGGFESIQFSNSVIRQSLATNMKHPFKQKSGLTGIDIASSDGAIIRNVNIANISIDSLENPIFIKLGNRLRRTSATPPGKKGVIKGIRFSQISVKNSGISPVTITGFPDNYVSDINFRDVFIEHRGGGTIPDKTLDVAENAGHYPGTRMFTRKLPASGFYIRHVKNIRLDNVQLEMLGGDQRPAFVCEDVSGLELVGFKFKSLSPLENTGIIKDSKDVHIRQAPGTQGRVQQINSNAIVIE